MNYNSLHDSEYSISASLWYLSKSGKNRETKPLTYSQKNKALSIGNREREKYLIDNDDEKNKLIRKLKVHLKTNKNARKLGHYKD